MPSEYDSLWWTKQWSILWLLLWRSHIFSWNRRLLLIKYPSLLRRYMELKKTYGTSSWIRFYFVTNNKGPCPIGEWFVLEDSTGIPICESVPENCPIDGHHVYWSPDPSAAKKWWKLNTQGPCAKLQYISRRDGSEVFCRYRHEVGIQFFVSIAPKRNVPKVVTAININCRPPFLIYNNLKLGMWYVKPYKIMVCFFCLFTNLTWNWTALFRNKNSTRVFIDQYYKYLPLYIQIKNWYTVNGFASAATKPTVHFS